MNKLNLNVLTIDAIRGWAFLIVLIMHGIAICLDGSSTYLQGCGKFGVWLFFVLSAYLLTRNYVLSNGKKIEYLIGRVFRILPLYFICIFTYSLFDVFSPTTYDIFLSSLVLYGPIHLWTIPVEFYFYFILLLVWLIKNSIIRNCLMSFMALVSISFLFFTVKEPNTINVLWYMPSFYCGYMLAVISPKISPIKFGSTVPILIITGFIFLSPGAQFFLFGIDPSPYLKNMYLPISVLWAFFIFSILNTKSKFINHIFQSQMLIFLGNVSYSGYLFHWLVMVKIKNIMGSSITTVLVGIIISILIAYIVNTLIEMPIYKCRKIVIGKLYKTGVYGLPNNS